MGTYVIVVTEFESEVRFGQPADLQGHCPLVYAIIGFLHLDVLDMHQQPVEPKTTK